MSAELQKFWDMLNADESLQQKMADAVRNYSGEQTDRAVFEGVVVPLAKEQGITISVDDYISAVQELSQDEMAQVGGGAAPAVGGGFFGCYGLGGGVGSGGGYGSGGLCLIVGYGIGSTVCMLSGIAFDEDEVRGS